MGECIVFVVIFIEVFIVFVEFSDSFLGGMYYIMGFWIILVLFYISYISY